MESRLLNTWYGNIRRRTQYFAWFVHNSNTFKEGITSNIIFGKKRNLYFHRTE